MLQRVGGRTTAERVSPRTALEGLGKAFQKVRQVALRGAESPQHQFGPENLGITGDQEFLRSLRHAKWVGTDLGRHQAVCDEPASHASSLTLADSRLSSDFPNRPGDRLGLRGKQEEYLQLGCCDSLALFRLS